MRKKRDERPTEGPDKIPHEPSERSSAEEDAIDAAIKHSIEKIGA